MGEKDSPLDGLIDGKQRIITFYDVTDGKKIDDRIIADSLVSERESNLIDAQKTLVSGSFSFGCKIEDNEDNEALRELLFGGVDNDSVIKGDVIVEGEPYINRPKNLKYPNKKRARRIWNKWRKRFGVTPTTKYVMPNCTFQTNLIFERDNITTNVKVIPDKNNP